MTDGARAHARRAVVSVLGDCSNACVFCGFDGAVNASEESMRAIHAAGHRAITLGGGEPTLAPEALATAVRTARAIDFSSIVLQTNGHDLARLAASLRRWGLTDVHVSVLGPDAASHDYHTTRPGSFDRLWDGVAAARQAGLRVVATTVITRSSYRVLSGLPILLHARGVAAWQLAVPLARGHAQDDFDRVYPRLAMALPFALHAVEAARRLGMPTFIRGAPLCLLGPLAARSIDDEARAFHARCEGCAARASCPGIDPVYLARFDGDELRPRTDRPTGADGEALRALFAGPGALVPRRVAPIAEPVPNGRLSLPMYGRTQRGEREVASRDVKTGDALREILPALFDAGKSPEKDT